MESLAILFNLLYLLLGGVTFVVLGFLARSGMFSSHEMQGKPGIGMIIKCVRFLERIELPLVVSLGLLYLICYSFKIYWWGTWVFFALAIELGLLLWFVYKSKKPRAHFLEDLGDNKATWLWYVPRFAFFIYVYISSMGILFASGDKLSIFGVYV